MPDFNPYDWFWIVAGDESRYWSSAIGAYVTILPEAAGVTRILNEQELTDVLRAYNLPGPLVSLDDVYAERSRRLALGFDYDFGDARGVHHIGTTEGDMIGWNDVTTLANALVALGDTTTAINIVTDTGPTQVTALEWQQILLAAAAFRQPIWGASFAIQTANPVPADFRDDVYWV